MSSAVAPLSADLSVPGTASNVTLAPTTTARTEAKVIDFPDLTIDLRECADISITELVQQEAELAYANWIGDLHPHHAARLAAVSDELDRRWAAFG